MSEISASSWFYYKNPNEHSPTGCSHICVNDIYEDLVVGSVGLHLFSLLGSSSPSSTGASLFVFCYFTSALDAAFCDFFSNCWYLQVCMHDFVSYIPQSICCCSEDIILIFL